ncbi:MAG: hypothetical protein L6R41_008191 [Letrouitia leprolyta]|nr:MAG: hypothetical protein L6R41_008191 [Letrouitia leprolyta]
MVEAQDLAVHESSVARSDLFTLRDTSELDKRINQTSSITNFHDGTIEYHVPNTDVTLFLDPGASYSSLTPVLRDFLSTCITEVENIIDIAGDGIIPGFRNQFTKTQTYTDGYFTTEIHLNTLSYSYIEAHKMTYGILLATLRGLRHVLVIERLGKSLVSIYIRVKDKGTVGLGNLAVIRRPVVSSSSS